MRIVFINQFYPPDVASSGQHLRDLAREAAASGAEVEILTSRSAYEGGLLGAPVLAKDRGITVRRLPSLGPRSRRTRWRFLDAFSWHFFVMLWVIFHRREVVVTLTSPPLVTVWGTLHSFLHRSRHVAWTLDLHPDVEFSLGVLSRRSLPGRLLDFLDRLSLRRAAAVVALGPTQRRRLLDKGVKAQRLRVVPIWPSGPELVPAGERPADGPFVVLYSGNAGHAHRFDEVLHAAERLQARGSRIRFAFHGGGAQRHRLEDEVVRRDLRNVEFGGYRELADLQHALSEADVHLVTLQPEMSGIAVPSKLQSALAVGRPVVFVGGHDADAVTWLGEGGGLLFGPGQGRDLADGLEALARNSELRARHAREARSLYERWFRRKPACRRLVAILRDEPEPPVREARRCAPAQRMEV